MKNCLFTLFFFLSINASAQINDYITGKVLDKGNSPLPGVTVLVFSDTQMQKKIAGSLTDIKGNYKIAVPDTLKYLTIRYSYIGMKPKEFKIKRNKK